MMTIDVVSPGLLTTVQDLGRFGYGPLGVSACGAADPVSLRIGNALVGNPANAAALEMTLAGGSFRFAEEATVAITGGTIQGATMWQTLEGVRDLKLGRIIEGARAYLCIAGGIQTPVVLGSRSTHLPTGIGGRALRRGDILPIGVKRYELPRRVTPPADLVPRCLRVTTRSGADLEGRAYTVTPDSDRSGLRLRGPGIETPHSGSMVTEGMPLGAIQVPASGQPIILFVDQQTTGGYPIVANVIAADLHRIGQLRPGAEVSFEYLSIGEARQIYLQQEAWLGAL